MKMQGKALVVLNFDTNDRLDYLRVFDFETQEDEANSRFHELFKKEHQNAIIMSIERFNEVIKKGLEDDL